MGLSQLGSAGGSFVNAPVPLVASETLPSFCATSSKMALQRCIIRGSRYDETRSVKLRVHVKYHMKKHMKKLSVNMHLKRD